MNQILDDTFLILGATPPPSNARRLRLGAFQERSVVAGPGQRAVLWVAGCLRRCPECIKPDLFSFDAGEDVAVEDLADRILQIPGLDGVTYSGGEPFEQASALASLSERLKPHGHTIVAYTGYRVADLRAIPDRFGSLLAQVDILIDGEYRRDIAGPLPWRGSVNQNIHSLTVAGMASAGVSGRMVREVQASLTPTGVRLSGFPDKHLQKQLAEQLEMRGIIMREQREHRHG